MAKAGTRGSTVLTGGSCLGLDLEAVRPRYRRLVVRQDPVRTAARRSSESLRRQAWPGRSGPAGRRGRKPALAGLVQQGMQAPPPANLPLCTRCRSGHYARLMVSSKCSNGIGHMWMKHTVGTTVSTPVHRRGSKLPRPRASQSGARSPRLQRSGRDRLSQLPCLQAVSSNQSRPSDPHGQSLRHTVLSGIRSVP